MIARLAAYFAPEPLPVITPLPPHVAGLRLNMGLMELHMRQAENGPSDRTRAGNIQLVNKEYKG